MKSNLYFLLGFFFLFLFQFEGEAQVILKSVTSSDVPIDTIAETVTSPVIITDGGDNVTGKWFINDGDPSGWAINKEVYDSDLDSYIDELIGHRKDGDANNTNSFRLWAPTDSGVVWNVSSPIVKFRIKITDGEDWTFGNEGNLGIYFWVTIWDDYKMEYRTRKVRYNKGAVGVLDNGAHWSDYTPHGLGEDIDDGKWHEITVNLKSDIQESRDMAYDDGNGDLNAGKYWKFYSITAIEIRAVHMFIDHFTVLPETAQGVEKHSLNPDLSVYPNPSTGDITVKFNGDTNSAQINISDMLGHVVASFNNVTTETKLDLNNYPKGVYLMTVNKDGKISAKRTLILK